MLFIPGRPTPHSLGIGTNLTDYWVCRMIRIDQTRKRHIKHYHFFWSKIVGAENSSSQEFYKRAAEMFELADHSESNFSKSLVATKGRGSGVYPAKHPLGKVVSFMAWGTTCRAGFLKCVPETLEFDDLQGFGIVISKPNCQIVWDIPRNQPKL